MPLTPNLTQLAGLRDREFRDGVCLAAGSRRVSCAGCGARVWMPPVSQQMLAAGTHQAVCLNCLRAEMERRPELATFSITTEQIAEIAGHLGRDPRAN